MKQQCFFSWEIRRLSAHNNFHNQFLLYHSRWKSCSYIIRSTHPFYVVNFIWGLINAEDTNSIRPATSVRITSCHQSCSTSMLSSIQTTVIATTIVIVCYHKRIDFGPLFTLKFRIVIYIHVHSLENRQNIRFLCLPPSYFGDLLKVFHLQ